MIPLPDLGTYSMVEWPQFKWLLDKGVPLQLLMDLTPIRVARGVVAHDGRFDDDPEGQYFLVFPETEDAVFWQPRTGELASWNGRAFALGEDVVYNAGTCSFDGYLNLLPDPLEWLRRGRDGCVVLDWSRAWSRLQDVPRIAVHEDLLVQYRRHMKPSRAPEVFVLADAKGIAA